MAASIIKNAMKGILLNHEQVKELIAMIPEKSRTWVIIAFGIINFVYWFMWLLYITGLLDKIIGYFIP